MSTSVCSCTHRTKNRGDIGNNLRQRNKTRFHVLRVLLSLCKHGYALSLSPRTYRPWVSFLSHILTTSVARRIQLKQSWCVKCLGSLAKTSIFWKPPKHFQSSAFCTSKARRNANSACRGNAFAVGPESEYGEKPTIWGPRMDRLEIFWPQLLPF